MRRCLLHDWSKWGPIRTLTKTYLWGTEPCGRDVLPIQFRTCTRCGKERTRRVR